MNSFKSSLAYWASVLGSIVALLGLVQSFNWLAAIGAALLTGSVVAVAYASKQHRLLAEAAVRVEGRTIDSLNVATLQRRVNRNLFLQEARTVAVIRREDLSLSWDCAGYCRAGAESSIAFSIDADNNIPFAELKCFAFDLLNDPTRKYPIRPILLGPDGISKKIAVPLLSPVSMGEPFRVALTCDLPGCMKSGVDYYTASVSFAQDTIYRYAAELIFEQNRPEWLRVYERDASGSPRLLRDLPPGSVAPHRAVYRDHAEDLPAQAVRLYVFRRDLTAA